MCGGLARRSGGWSGAGNADVRAAPLFRCDPLHVPYTSTRAVCLQILSQRQQNAVSALRDEEDARGWGRTPGSMQYAYLHFNLLIASAVQGRSSVISANDGTGSIRIGRPGCTNQDIPLRAIARACELWTDPRVRESCGDALAPGASFATTVMQMFSPRPGIQLMTSFYNSRLELAPGLSRDGAVMAAVGELADGAFARQQAGTLLRTIAALQAQMQAAYDDSNLDVMLYWAPLGWARRAAAVHYVVSRIERGFDLQEEEFAPEISEILAAATGETHDDRMAIWRLAAELSPAELGWYDTNAFFHWLLRRCAGQQTSALEIDIVKELDFFGRIGYSYKRLGPGERTDVDERWACTKLVMPPPMFKDWLRMFGPDATM